jgi:hypothetical protein
MFSQRTGVTIVAEIIFKAFGFNGTIQRKHPFSKLRLPVGAPDARRLP